MALNQMYEKNLEDILFGSIIGLIGNVIAFLLLYFGGGKEIPWLCIVGFIIAAIAILIPFVNRSNGVTNLLGVIFLLLLSHFKLIDAASNFFAFSWIAGNSNIDVFYVARLLAVVLVTSTCFLIVRALNAKQDLRRMGS